jgi:hypothetical protein
MLCTVGAHEITQQLRQVFEGNPGFLRDQFAGKWPVVDTLRKVD